MRGRREVTGREATGKKTVFGKLRVWLRRDNASGGAVEARGSVAGRASEEFEAPEEAVRSAETELARRDRRTASSASEEDIESEGAVAGGRASEESEEEDEETRRAIGSKERRRYPATLFSSKDSRAASEDRSAAIEATGLEAEILRSPVVQRFMQEISSRPGDWLLLSDACEQIGCPLSYDIQDKIEEDGIWGYGRSRHDDLPYFADDSRYHIAIEGERLKVLDKRNNFREITDPTDRNRALDVLNRCIQAMEPSVQSTASYRGRR